MSVFAVIDTETTGFNKHYDRIIELAAVRADAYFKPVDSWHTLLNPDTNAVSTTRGTPPFFHFPHGISDLGYSFYLIDPESL